MPCEGPHLLQRQVPGSVEADGRLFTRAYYRFGPHAANAIRHRPAARARRLLGPILAHAARRLGSQ